MGGITIAVFSDVKLLMSLPSDKAAFRTGDGKSRTLAPLKAHRYYLGTLVKAHCFHRNWTSYGRWWDDLWDFAQPTEGACDAFKELLHHDNEDCDPDSADDVIGSEVAAKLARDFTEYDVFAQQFAVEVGSRWYDEYKLYHEALTYVAEHHGALVFSS
jgi:hypothetical protein